MPTRQTLRTHSNTSNQKQSSMYGVRSTATCAASSSPSTPASSLYTASADIPALAPPPPSYVSPAILSAATTCFTSDILSADAAYRRHLWESAAAPDWGDELEGLDGSAVDPGAKNVAGLPSVRRGRAAVSSQARRGRPRARALTWPGRTQAGWLEPRTQEL